MIIAFNKSQNISALFLFLCSFPFSVLMDLLSLACGKQNVEILCTTLRIDIITWCHPLLTPERLNPKKVLVPHCYIITSIGNDRKAAIRTRALRPQRVECPPESNARPRDVSDVDNSGWWLRARNSLSTSTVTGSDKALPHCASTRSKLI